jgi:hypothetical protein
MKLIKGYNVKLDKKQHMFKVYEKSGGFFGTKKKLLMEVSDGNARSSVMLILSPKEKKAFDEHKQREFVEDVGDRPWHDTQMEEGNYLWIDWGHPAGAVSKPKRNINFQWVKMTDIKEINLKYGTEAIKAA